MNNEDALAANTDGFGHVTTFCHYATGHCVRIEDQAPGPVLETDGRPPYATPLSPEHRAMDEEEPRGVFTPEG